VGLALAMAALSGIGVVSVLSGANGVPVPLAGMLGADLGAAWLANKSAAGPRASNESSAHTALATVAPSSTAPSSTAPSNAAPAASADADARSGGRGPTSAGMTDDGKVILNLASTEELRHLPGVGAKRAEAILALRARLGRFKQVNELLRVKGIGVRGLKKIMPHVVLDAPKPSA